MLRNNSDGVQVHCLSQVNSWRFIGSRVQANDEEFKADQVTAEKPWLAWFFFFSKKASLLWFFG